MLDRKVYLVKERVAVLKLTDTYDIHDAATGETLGTAAENVSGLIKVMRLLVSKRLLPTTVDVKGKDGRLVMSITRTGLLRSTVTVQNARGQGLGSFKSKLLSIGGHFFVHDTAGRQVAEVKGDWKGWNFRFTTLDGTALGQVTRKWGGIGRELFTSADNYVIALDEKAALPPETSALLIAAGLAIDIVYKEQ